jgi:hypothetical protein
VVLLLVDRVADGLMVTCYDGWNDRERERERVRMAETGCWRVVFWPILDPKFLHL